MTSPLRPASAKAPCFARSAAATASSTPYSPFGEKVLAILDGLLTFKLDNRHLISAREVTGTGMLQSEPYRWMHTTLRELIEQTDSGAPDRAGYTAHVLFGGLRADLIDELLVTGDSPEAIRRAQAGVARRVLDLADPPSDLVSD